MASTSSVVQSKKTSAIWEFPWAYRESFILAFTLNFCGFFLQYINQGVGPYIPPYPGNIILLSIFCSALILIQVFAGKHRVVFYLSSVPIAVAALSSVLFLVFIMGSVLQVDEPGTLLTRLGLTNITGSWAFAFSLTFMQVVLGLTTIRRILPINRRNFAFFLNHFGLFLAVCAGALGSSDIRKLRMDTIEQEIIHKGIDDSGHIYDIPLAVRLNDFEIDFYRPKVSIVNNISGQIIYDDKRIMPEIFKGMNISMSGWNLKVINYLESAAPVAGRYIKVNEEGTAPAAEIMAVRSDGYEVRGWMTCGSYRFPYKSMKLDENYSLIMTIPEAKAFRSNITCYNPDGDELTKELQVNRPVLFDGWTIYQVSFDERFGKDSNLSVLEVTRDPWLPVVYCSIFTMLAGALMLLFFENEIGRGSYGAK